MWFGVPAPARIAPVLRQQWFIIQPSTSITTIGMPNHAKKNFIGDDPAVPSPDTTASRLRSAFPDDASVAVCPAASGRSFLLFLPLTIRSPSVAARPLRAQRFRRLQVTLPFVVRSSDLRGSWRRAGGIAQRVDRPVGGDVEVVGATPASAQVIVGRGRWLRDTRPTRVERGFLTGERGGGVALRHGKTGPDGDRWGPRARLVEP